MAEATAAGSYAGAATKVFAAVCSHYAEPVVYWRLGNGFDAIVDYLDNVDASSAAATGDMVVAQYNASIEKLGYDNAWFDDFGWWTIATDRAIGKSFFSGIKNTLTAFRGECWSRFTGNAPYVWERRKPGSFDDYGPAVEGGVWNEYWVGTSSKFPGPKVADPSKGTLQGIQNTVTNALYLMAAQRLGRTDPVANVAAEREFRFLDKWMFYSGDRGLWWPQDVENVALVRERVGSTAKLSPVTGFQMDWAWMGDQGLIVGALVDRMATDSQNYPRLLSAAKALLTGATMQLDSDGVLLDYTNSGSVPDGDRIDYATGPGVFWRNMLYAWKNNPDLTAFLSTDGMRRLVKTNADAAINALDSNDFDTLVNRLAILVAAAAILGVSLKSMDVTIGRQVEFHDDAGRLFATYHYDDPYKSFFRGLCTPGGRDVVDPPPLDHPHHKGLQYGLCATDVNFWEEDAATEPAHRRIGRQMSQSVEPLNNQDGRGFTQTSLWRDDVCESFKETRAIVVRKSSPSSYVWTWRTTLLAQRDVELVVSAWPQQGGYCGLGLRLEHELFLRKSRLVSTPADACKSGAAPASIAVHGNGASVTFAQGEQRDVLFVMGCKATDTAADFAFLALGPTNGAAFSVKKGARLVGAYTVVVENS